MSDLFDDLEKESHQIIDEWIISCTRRKGIARNTVAVGIVVLDHLRQSCPVNRDDVISQGGEIRGTRSGLINTLEKYGIPVCVKDFETTS